MACDVLDVPSSTCSSLLLPGKKRKWFVIARANFPKFVDGHSVFFLHSLPLQVFLGLREF